MPPFPHEDDHSQLQRAITRVRCVYYHLQNPITAVTTTVNRSASGICLRLPDTQPLRAMPLQQNNWRACDNNSASTSATAVTHGAASVYAALQPRPLAARRNPTVNTETVPVSTARPGHSNRATSAPATKTLSSELAASRQKKPAAVANTKSPDNEPLASANNPLAALTHQLNPPRRARPNATGQQHNDPSAEPLDVADASKKSASSLNDTANPSPPNTSHTAAANSGLSLLKTLTDQLYLPPGSAIQPRRAQPSTPAATIKKSQPQANTAGNEANRSMSHSASGYPATNHATSQTTSPPAHFSTIAELPASNSQLTNQSSAFSRPPFSNSTAGTAAGQPPLGNPQAASLTTSSRPPQFNPIANQQLLEQLNDALKEDAARHGVTFL
jgi:hypothetical protein